MEYLFIKNFKISRYKNQVSANVKIYYRQKKYDRLIYEFYEKRDASFSLISNNVRSTMASKKNAELTSTRLLSEEIYKYLNFSKFQMFLKSKVKKLTIIFFLIYL